MSRHARPNTALHGSSRTRPRWMPLDITVDGRNTPPLAPTEGGNPPGTCGYATQTCNKNYKIYESFYPHSEPPALPTCPSVFALDNPRGKTPSGNPSRPAHDNCTPNQEQWESTSPPLPSASAPPNRGASIRARSTLPGPSTWPRSTLLGRQSSGVHRRIKPVAVWEHPECNRQLSLAQ